MFASIVGAISNFMYSYLLIVMLVAVGLYYTPCAHVWYSCVCSRRQFA